MLPSFLMRSAWPFGWQGMACKHTLLNSNSALATAHFQHQLINTFHEAGRIVELTTLGQQGLVK
jgi:hypothetical protein